ncbi:MAG: putative glycolipid-binding domain-containing protein [Ginsengibacter sp.]
MKKNILWKGLHYASMENCMITTNAEGYIINSQLTGTFEDKILRIDYQLQLDWMWHTMSVIANSRHGEHTNALSFISDTNGNWWFNGTAVDEFKDCLDVDISITPFTNTIPIKRLKLNDSEAQVIKVLYMNLPKEELHIMEQRYTRISATSYLYQNVGSKFEAVITTDENGLVTNYPEIFERLAIEDI